jgi:hypothetical protein
MANPENGVGHSFFAGVVSPGFLRSAKDLEVIQDD